MDKFIKPLSTSVIGDENIMDLQTMANGRGLSGERGRGREELVCLDGWRLPRRHKRISDGKREGGERVRADSPQPIGPISPARGNEVIFKAWYTELIQKKDSLVS